MKFKVGNIVTHTDPLKFKAYYLILKVENGRYDVKCIETGHVITGSNLHIVECAYKALDYGFNKDLETILKG